MGKLDPKRLWRRNRAALGVSRRGFLGAAAAASALPLLSGCDDSGGRQASALQFDGMVEFRHGVASGDPEPDSVVLWTRVTPGEDMPVPVRWEIAEDEAMEEVVAHGTVVTDASRDYTVKVVPRGLEPHRHYWYRFSVGEARSMSGRTKTAPAPGAAVERVRFAITSCALYSFGYFNAYGGVARQPDLDVVFSLGDYIYEYGADDLEGTNLLPERHMPPSHAAVSLDDYRTRHAVYKTDPDLQAAHAAHPWICTWDDHETANNSYDDGAGNHDEAVDGPWQDRKRAGIQAYFEWLPVREEYNPNHGADFYRRTRYGDLVEFFVLDTRFDGRSPPPENAEEAVDPDRMMMSAAQERWLIDGMRRSGARWKVVAQQTMLAPLELLPGEPFLADSWSGYIAQRNRLFEAFGGSDGGPAIDNVVVVSGDIHSTFCNELTPDSRDRESYVPGERGSVGVEFVCPSVTTPLAIPIGVGAYFRLLHPHIRHSEGTSDGGHGYAVLDIDARRCEAAYFYPLSVLLPSQQERSGRVLQLREGETVLRLMPLLAGDP